jgi:hypothetical protein
MLVYSAHAQNTTLCAWQVNASPDTKPLSAGGPELLLAVMVLESDGVGRVESV